MADRQRQHTKYREAPQRSTAPLILTLAGALLLLFAVVLIFDPLGFFDDIPAEPPVTGAEVSRISLGDARAAYETGTAVFVDTRDAVAFSESHIPGAVSIPLTELNSRIGELDKADWIITYCT